MARKLFPIYGSALANNMLACIERGSLVGDFVAVYMDEYDRSGILGGADRDRELVETIGREVVLAMIVEIPRVLPRFFGKTQGSKLTKDEKESIEAFFGEWMAALGRAWNWKAEDKRRFSHDLELYSNAGAPRIAGKKARKQEKTPQEEPPFIGRVALLLDPSMLDQARQAARKYHDEVKRLAPKILRQTLQPGRK
ncbi:MAG TPA: hypothetical protein VNI36_00090 [Candidatus Dormibacteraeota bacterium]|nr:hypothetical protein [Candidatus Dormibacteraeota bacterium]